MHSTEKKDLKKYLSPSIRSLIFSGIWYIFAIVAPFFAANPILVCIFCLVIAIFFTIPTVFSFFKMHKFIKNSEKNNTLSIILDDFKNGHRYLNNSLCLGSNYMIGRHGITAIAYSDVTMIYEYISKAGFRINSHQLMIRTKDKNSRGLCDLPLNQIPEKEVLSVFDYIKKKNTSIKTGKIQTGKRIRV